MRHAGLVPRPFGFVGVPRGERRGTGDHAGSQGSTPARDGLASIDVPRLTGIYREVRQPVPKPIESDTIWGLCPPPPAGRHATGRRWVVAAAMLIWLVVGGSVALTATGQDAGDDPPPLPTAEALNRGRALLRAGDLTAATELARSLGRQWLAANDEERAVPADESSDASDRELVDDQRITAAAAAAFFAQVGRAAYQQGDAETAADVFALAVRATEIASGERSSGISGRQAALIRLAAAAAWARSGRDAEAIDCLTPIVSAAEREDAGLGEEAGSGKDAGLVEDAARRLLALGAAAIRRGDAVASKAAYEGAQRFYERSFRADDSPSEASPVRASLATAMLGAGWAAAMGGSEPIAAAEALGRFVDRFPEHADAPHAQRARAACLDQAGDGDAATRTLAALIDRWPEHELDLPSLSRVVALLEAEADSEAEMPEGDRRWRELARRLAAADGSGQEVTERLRHWQATGRESAAIWLASELVRGESLGDESLGDESADDESGAANGQQRYGAEVRDAAALWLGRSGRWGRLAAAAEEQSPGDGGERRGVTLERLVAEALTQTGRPAEARVWWEHLVDTRGLDDFPTLLRCAETSAPLVDLERAAERIAAAKRAAGDDAAGVVLVKALEAEWEIRRARFDQARGLLEAIVRDAASPPGLRGRAQWLIGETHYLQQRFSQAIEAYRVVEGIDETGLWVPAALIQAGKSFEQLGRTREATVCYLSLLRRYGDSEHAATARRRLAAIEPDRSVPSVPQAAGSETRRR